MIHRGLIKNQVSYLGILPQIAQSRHQIQPVLNQFIKLLLLEASDNQRQVDNMFSNLLGKLRQPTEAVGFAGQ